ncbi:MAG: hypothetical protein AAFO29_17585 [Actinomycetota bacterium]
MAANADSVTPLHSLGDVEKVTIVDSHATIDRLATGTEHATQVIGSSLPTPTVLELLPEHPESTGSVAHLIDSCTDVSELPTEHPVLDLDVCEPGLSEDRSSGIRGPEGRRERGWAPTKVAGQDLARWLRPTVWMPGGEGDTTTGPQATGDLG